MRQTWLRAVSRITVCTFLVPAAALADCSTLAKWGIYDYRTDTGTDERVSSFASWFCSRDIGSYQQAQQISASLGFPIGDLPVKLGWDQNDSSWRTWEKTFCQTIATNAQQRTTVSTFLQTANAGVLQVISTCLKYPGVHAWLSQGADQKKFLVNLAFTPFSSITQASVKDVLISPTSAQKSCRPQLPLDASHKVISASQSLTLLCDRPDPDSVLVAINADQPLTVDDPLTLTAISSSPPPPQLPSIKLQRFCATGDKAGHASASVDVDAGYKIVGGGANVNWSGQGNFLEASFPETLTRWRAWSKDHAGSGKGGADPATITVCAVGLYDQNDEWDVRIFSSSSQSKPTQNDAYVAVDEGYVMTGGGANVPDDPVGQLLYGSYPADNRSWVAKSHDKYVSSSRPITAYAIGIRPRNGAKPPVVKIVPGTGNYGSQSIGTAPVDVGWNATGGGAFADFGGAGNFLTGSMPNETAWYAKSSDQGDADPLSVKIYVFEVQAIGSK